MVAEPRWCTTAEAAARLEVTRPTVIAWLRNGTLRGQLDDGAERRTWRVEVKSVQDCLAARGGPGARRGRPPGSIAELVAEIASMRRRLDALEADTGRDPVTTPSLTVLSGLVELLRAEGADTAARSQRFARTTEHLAALLNTKNTLAADARGRVPPAATGL